MISAKHLLSILLLGLTLTGPARADEPIQPSMQITFSEGVVNKLTNEPMPDGGNWAFDISIENPNDRDLFCRLKKLPVRLGIFTRSCESAPYVSYLELTPPGEEGITIKAGETFQLSEAGYEDRESKTKAEGKTLEYCGAEAGSMKCGYICSNGKPFGKDWEERINASGKRKYICDENGEIKLTEVFCDTDHRPGDTWVQREATSTRTFSCGTSGGITESVECISSPLHSKNAAGECVPASCGATAHDKPGTIDTFDNGKVVARCEYGTWVDSKRECNAGFKLVAGGACQSYASCGAHAHGSPEWIVRGTCRNCERTDKKYRCEDGQTILTQTLWDSCPPARNRICP